MCRHACCSPLNRWAYKNIERKLLSHAFCGQSLFPVKNFARLFFAEMIYLHMQIKYVSNMRHYFWQRFRTVQLCKLGGGRGGGVIQNAKKRLCSLLRSPMCNDTSDCIGQKQQITFSLYQIFLHMITVSSSFSLALVFWFSLNTIYRRSALLKMVD